MADNGYNKVSYIAGMICDMLRLAAKQDKIVATSPEKRFREDLELILDLSNRKVKDVTDLTKDLNLKIDQGWRQCDYILYALFFGLCDKVPLKMLENLPGEKIVELQKTINIAKERGCPTPADVKIAEELGDRFARLATTYKNDSIKKAQANIVRFSAFLTKMVNQNWDDLKEQMNKWSDAVDERVAVDGLDKLRGARPLNLPLNPNPQEIARPVVQKPREEKKEVRKVMEPKTRVTEGDGQNGITSPVVTVVEEKKIVAEKKPEPAKEERWTIEELAAKLGYKNITSIHIKQTGYLEQHPDDKEAQKFFQECFVYTYDGRKRKWFVAKYFEELKKYIPLMGETGKYPEVITDEKGRVLWKTDKVASELGFNSTEYFLKRRKDLIEKNSAVGTWFKEDGPTLYFYSEHIDELRILLQPITNTREDVIKDKDGNELWSIKKLVAELGLPNEMCFFNRKSRLIERYPDAENYFVKIGNAKYFKATGDNLNEFKALLKKMGERPDRQKGNKSDKPAKKSVKAGAGVKQPFAIVGIERVTDETPVPELVQMVVEQPTDLLGLKSLDAMLTELQKRYAAALEDQKKKEKKYNKLFDAAERAEQELSDANKHVKDLEDNIAKAKSLSQAYNEINQFLFDTTQVLEK